MPTEQTTGLIFFSHSKDDKDYVEQLVGLIDNSILFYDLRSIDPGENNLEVIRDSALRSSLFVFFISPNVGPESWARFEAKIAEVQSYKRNGFRVLVVPIKGSKYSDAPEWMGKYFATDVRYSVRDVARTIMDLYREALLSQGSIVDDVFSGREVLQQKIQNAARQHIATTGSALNVLILSGIPGIGRRSLARHVRESSFPGMRAAAPEFDLPDAAGAVDIYLKLLEDIRGSLNKSEIEKQITTFPAEPGEQARLIVELLRHWGETNHPVIISARWALRARGNEIEPFANELFRELQSKPEIKLIVVTTRRLPPAALLKFKNILQFEVNELAIEAILDIISRRVTVNSTNSTLAMSLASKAYGHPATANYVCMLIENGRTLDSLIEAPSDIYSFQDKVLSAIYDGAILDELEKDILSVLSWFPNLSVRILAEIFPDFTREQIAERVWNLFEHSLLTRTDLDGYRVPELVRSRTRRDVNRLTTELVDTMSATLARILASNELSVALIESILFSFASAAGEIPDQIKGLITPGTLRAVVEKEYDLGRGAVDRVALEHFNKTAKLARLARHIGIPNKHTLEDILFFGGDALARRGEDPAEFIAAMRAEGFSSADYIDGSYRFHKLRDYDGAIECLSRSLDAGFFRRRTTRLLTRIYLNVGKAASAIGVLDRLRPGEVENDTGFLSMRIRALRSLGQIGEADQLETKLRQIDNEFGEFEILMASKALRDKNLEDAKSWVERAKQKPKVNKVTLSFFDCVVHIEAGDESLLPSACDLAIAAGREGDARQLIARAALKRGDWKKAETELKQIAHKNRFDLQLWFDVLQLKKAAPELQGNAAAQDALRSEETLILGTIRRTIEF